MIAFDMDQWNGGDPNPFKKNIKAALDAINVDQSYAIVLNSPECKAFDLQAIATVAGKKNWTSINIPKSFLEKRAIVGCGDKRYTIDFDILTKDTILFSKKLEEEIDTDSKATVFCEDMGDTEIYLKEAYDKLPIYIEDEANCKDKDLVKLDDKEMPLLGVYWHDGSLSGRSHCMKGQPIIVLFRNNIKKTSKEIKKDLQLQEDLATVEHHLAAFVLTHELAHAFFDKEKMGNNYNTVVKQEIEECLANYAALLHAHKKGGLYNMIGKALVNRQKNLNNKGYYHAISLFDVNEKPAFSGWWKWRYNHNLINGVNYQCLKPGTDLSDFLDFGIK